MHSERGDTSWSKARKDGRGQVTWGLVCCDEESGALVECSGKPLVTCLTKKLLGLGCS